MNDADRILTHLTEQQHLHPSRPLTQVLQGAVERVGCCPRAIAEALQWLNLDGRRPIGRLRRSEIVQLAHAAHRFWRRNLLATAC